MSDYVLNWEMTLQRGSTPTMLRRLYNISAEGGRTNMTQAVASFLHEYFSNSDLLAFQQEFSPLSRGRTPVVKGSNIASSPTLEASLDVVRHHPLAESPTPYTPPPPALSHT